MLKFWEQRDSPATWQARNDNSKHNGYRLGGGVPTVVQLQEYGKGVVILFNGKMSVTVPKVGLSLVSDERGENHMNFTKRLILSAAKWQPF